MPLSLYVLLLLVRVSSVSWIVLFLRNVIWKLIFKLKHTCTWPIFTFSHSIFDVSAMRRANTTARHYLVRHTDNHSYILSTIYNSVYQYIIKLLHAHISCISGWCRDGQNTRTLITQVNFAQMILSLFYILTYFTAFV